MPITLLLGALLEFDSGTFAFELHLSYFHNESREEIRGDLYVEHETRKKKKVIAELMSACRLRAPITEVL